MKRSLAAKGMEWGPEYLGPAFGAESSAVTLPDGTLFYLYTDNGHNKSPNLYSRTSADGGRTWSEPVLEFTTPFVPYPNADSQPVETITWNSTAIAVDGDGEIHAVFQVMYGTGAIAVTRFLDVYHCRTVNGRQGWSAPVPIRSGIWCGAAKGFAIVQKEGRQRLVAAFGEWIAQPAAGEGQLASHAYYSDDNGVSWKEAEYEGGGRGLAAPVSPDFGGNNYGAIEGCIVEIAEGYLKLLLRTQTGYLYESVSADGGSWSKVVPASFRSSSSPAYAARLTDGRVVVVWCNQVHLPVMEGEGPAKQRLYSGRDALHAAISDDGGITWRGFREVYLDPKRNETPGSGDVGVAYPNVNETADGHLFLTTGQGDSTAMLRFHPDWLYESRRSENFVNGLNDWSTYTAYGIGVVGGIKAPRCEGACLIHHPDLPDRKVLHVRKADTDKAADGANWNFPGGSGTRGVLRLRVRFHPSFQGAQLSLNDAFYDPWFSDGEKQAIFTLSVDESGMIDGGGRLALGQWHTLVFAWDLSRRVCEVSVDGQRTMAVLRQLNPPLKGTPVSYLRLKSKAKEGTSDLNGFMVESVFVDTNPQV